MAYYLTNLINEVLPDVIGCPQPLIEATTRTILKEFCATGILNKGFKHDVLATDPATPNDHIDIATPAAMALYAPVNILSMRIDGVAYDARRLEISDDLTDIEELEENRVKFWYPSTATNIIMYPFPAAACQIYLQVAFRPAASGVFLINSPLDDRFYDDWHETIVAGVKAKLLVMPKKAWTGDAGIVQWYQGIYDQGRRAALASVVHSMDKAASKAKNQFI